METQFFDVFVTEGENPTFAYRTGLTTYTEGLRDGIFTALGWNGAGYMALAQDGYDPTILEPGGLYRAAGRSSWSSTASRSCPTGRMRVWNGSKAKTTSLSRSRCATPSAP